MNDSRRALEIETLRGDVRHDQMAGGGMRSDCRVLAKPPQDRGPGHRARAEAGPCSGAPGHWWRPESIAEVPHRLAVRAEDQCRPPVGEQTAKALQFAVGLRLKTDGRLQDLADAVQIVELEIALLFARRHELPPDQLILERPGEAPDGGAVERRAGRGGISRVEQQPAVPSDRRRQSGRTRRRRASEY